MEIFMNKDEIILYGHSGSGNHGCEAIIRSTMKLLKTKCLVYSNNIEQDEKYGIDSSVLRQYSNTIAQNSIRRYFYAIYCRIFRHSMIRYKYAYKPFFDRIEADKVYLSVGGDHYCYGSYSNHIYDFLSNTIKDAGSKSVLWSCSIEDSDLDENTIQSLKRYDLITARESITYQTLLDKGIDKNVLLAPDVAFQLDMSRCDLPKGFQEGNTVGINISPMIQKYGEDGKIVIKNYEKVIEYLLDKTNCTIALIPHVVWEDTDDRKPLTQIYEKFKDSSRIIMIKDRPAEELKYIISRCCFFVGARTHATIAAYSTCVPTLVVGYSVKARGIARDIFGTEDGYVIPVQSMSKDNDLLEGFKKLWINRDEIQQYLNKQMPQYCARAWESVDALQSL